MKTLIDFDSPCYAIAAACDGAKWNYKGRQWELKSIAVAALEAEGKDPAELYQTKEPEPWENVEKTIYKYLDDFISNLNNPFNMQMIIGGGKNFRYDIATIKPYKGHRVQELPYHFNGVRDFVCETYGVKKVYGVETDDAMGILYEPGDIIVSQDKDLLQIPGKHYNYNTKKEIEVDSLTGLKNFYSQVLLGDTSDNIPGLHGVGPKSAYIKAIEHSPNEEVIFRLVKDLYEDRFGSYWKLFLLENCRLLWLIRNPDSVHCTVPLWMSELMEDYSFYTNPKLKEEIFERT